MSVTLKFLLYYRFFRHIVKPHKEIVYGKLQGGSAMSADKTQIKKSIFTIPNILSFFRICLIPVIVWLYCDQQNYIWTTLILLLSGLTDVVDGIIARRFHMVSDFGKILDPVADKLTQGVTLICLLSRYPYMGPLLILFIIKEICAAVTGLWSIHKTNIVEGAVWHGKLTTVALYAMMAIHLIWFHIPQLLSYILVGACTGIMLVSFALYMRRRIKEIV